MLILKDSASFNIPILMLDSVDHTTPKLGLSLDIKINKNFAGWTTQSGTVNEQGLGWYCLSGHLQDTNTYGTLLVHASGANADMFDSVHEVVGFNPRDPISMGMSFSNGVVVSGINYPVASGLANTILSQSVRCTQQTAPSGSLTEVILENVNSSVSSSTMTIKRTDGTTFSTKTLTLTAGANPIRGIGE